VVYFLIGALILMSTTGSVVASFSVSSQPSSLQAGIHEGHHGGMNHGGVNHARHDHVKALLNQKEKRDCLAYCFKALSGHYLAAAAPQIPQPKFTAVNSVLINPPGLSTQTHASFPGDGRRGPPGYLPTFSSSGLLGLLLLNARLRN